MEARRRELAGVDNGPRLRPDVSGETVTREALAEIDAALAKQAGFATQKDWGAVRIAEAIRFLALAVIFAAEKET
jgi:hypothetical protein